jgi:hypothetical protein
LAGLSITTRTLGEAAGLDSGAAFCAGALGGLDPLGVAEPPGGPEVLPPHSISPSDLELGAGAVSLAAGKMSIARKKKAVTSRQTHLRGRKDTNLTRSIRRFTDQLPADASSGQPLAT